METLQKNSLFWDIESESLDPDKHRDFIVRRILEKGDLEDLHWAENFYGLDELRRIFCHFYTKFDSKSANFWQIYFNIDKSKCIQKLSTKKLSAFSTK